MWADLAAGLAAVGADAQAVLVPAYERLVQLGAPVVDHVETIALVLVLLSVWRIGRHDLRGQYGMLAAQVFWCVAATLRGNVQLFGQSAVLLALTLRAIGHWRNGRFMPGRAGR